MAAGETGIIADSPVEIVSTGSAPGNSALSSGSMTSTASSSMAYATYKDRSLRTLVFDGSMSGSPASGSTIDIYERPLNISDTTDDQNAPTSSYKHQFVGQFVLDPGGTAQVIASNPFPIKPYDVEYYFFCNTSSVGIAATWSIDAIDHGEAVSTS